MHIFHTLITDSQIGNPVYELARGVKPRFDFEPAGLRAREAVWSCGTERNSFSASDALRPVTLASFQTDGCDWDQAVSTLGLPVSGRPFLKSFLAFLASCP